MANPVRPESPVFTKLAPDLDEGIAALPARDRQAVILRFLQQQNFNEVANTLGISESAAQMRVSRALERLRSFFRRRGVEVSATTLAVLFLAHAAPAAPLQIGPAMAMRALLPAHQLPAAARQLATATSRSFAAEAVASGVLVTVAALFVLGLTLSIGHLMKQPTLPWQPAAPRESSAMDSGKTSHPYPDSIFKAIGFSA